jgi:hypothetical protein
MANVPADDLTREIAARIAAEGERTRRHFDIVAERIQSDLALLASAVDAQRAKLDRSSAENGSEHATILSVLDDHELASGSSSGAASSLQSFERRKTIRSENSS